MTDTRTVFIDVTMACLQVVGVAWLFAAGYFALRLRRPWPARLGHFACTLLPEPWLFLLVPAVFGVLAVVPPGLWRHLRFDNPVLGGLGAAVAAVSAGLMLWARWVLGRMWAGRPLVQEGHELCTDGPYRIVRHPIYTGVVGLAAGATLAFGVGRLLLVLAVTVAFTAWRVRVEDRMMIATFGERYRAYRRRVPALIPRGAGRSQPDPVG